MRGTAFRQASRLILTRSQFKDGEQFGQPSVGEPILADRSHYELLAARVRSALQG